MVDQEKKYRAWLKASFVLMIVFWLLFGYMKGWLFLLLFLAFVILTAILGRINLRYKKKVFAIISLVISGGYLLALVVAAILGYNFG